jgi:hypothetical protein
MDGKVWHGVFGFGDEARVLHMGVPEVSSPRVFDISIITAILSIC